MVTKSEMLKLLQATEFPKNTGRTNVLKKGQTYIRGVVQALFGIQKWCYATKNKILQNCS